MPRAFVRKLLVSIAARLAVAACLLPAISTAGLAAEVASPLSPADSLAHLKIEPGLRVELVACEPEVVDPVAMRFDERGRLWVVEMRDYPSGPPEGQRPRSAIKVLTDTDTDGRYETARVFADELVFPTGLQAWKGGVIVTLAGEVVYMEDTDGDGRADRRETWYRGFTAENPQLRANHPRFALDNRVYVANGLRGGAIENPRREGFKPLSISGLDFRFDPHSGECEAVSGNGQFGLTFDDFGRRFVCNNRAPLDQVVLENRYLARNPLLAVPTALTSVARGGEQSRVYPLTAAWTTSNLHAGQFTAACGVEIFRGDGLGAEYQGNAFVCEPTGSLVHREMLNEAGPALTSRPAHDGVEFLASDDPWFRPVNLETGPDGALYVVDMYRAVIEHPQFMPSELQHRSDLCWGDDRGRIYRVVKADRRIDSTTPKLAEKSSAELAEVLNHGNAWWRETAARLLYERQDRTAAGRLAQLASDAPRAATRVQSLWALEGLGSLEPAVLMRGLQDDHPLVRVQAILLAESRLTNVEGLRAGVLATAADADTRVRFQAALSIGGLQGPEVIARLASIALAAPNDAWTRHAVATTVPQNMAPLLSTVLAARQIRGLRPGAGESLLIRQLATIVAARNDRGEVNALAALIADLDSAEAATARDAALAGVAHGLARHGRTIEGLLSEHPARGQIAPRFDALFARIAAEAVDESLDESVRTEKIDLLAYVERGAISERLLRLATSSPSQVIRTHAMAALASHRAQTIGLALVEALPAQTPAVRRAALDTLTATPERAKLLLDAIESGRIAKSEIDLLRTRALVDSGDATIKQRARKVLAPSPPAERKQVLADYRQALSLGANPTVGQELFRKHCATCHKIGQIGVDVGPDISDSRVKTPEQLLTDILNPNQAIDNNYASYTIAMHDGNIYTGVIGAETSASVTLRQPENKTLNLLRADIESIRSAGVSLMPEGFEKHLTRQEMADLIAFIKNWRYQTGSTSAAKGPAAGQ